MLHHSTACIPRHGWRSPPAPAAITGVDETAARLLFTHLESPGTSQVGLCHLLRGLPGQERYGSTSGNWGTLGIKIQQGGKAWGWGGSPRTPVGCEEGARGSTRSPPRRWQGMGTSWEHLSFSATSRCLPARLLACISSVCLGCCRRTRQALCWRRVSERSEAAVTAGPRQRESSQAKAGQSVPVELECSQKFWQGCWIFGTPGRPLRVSRVL